MPKFIELTLYSKYRRGDSPDNKMLIPVEAVTSIKEIGLFNLVFVKGLKLYAENYYEQQQYKHTPDPIDIEAIEVTNEYDTLKFLVLAGTGGSEDDK